MPEESEYESLPSSEEMLRAFSSEDMIKEARRSLDLDKPDIEVPDLETEVDIAVDFEEIAAREPEPRIETTFTPRRRPGRLPPTAVDPTVAAPHERPSTGRGLIIGIAVWIVILAFAIFLIAALAVEAP
jgi:hypothetical protein